MKLLLTNGLGVRATDGATRGRAVRVAFVVALVLLIVTSLPLALPGGAAPSPDGAPTVRTANGVPIDAEVAALWQETDAPVVYKQASRAWTFGPVALAASVEYTADNSFGLRSMVWYDKARLDILEPDADPASPWHVTGARLVAELLSGSVIYGSGARVTGAAPELAVVGDIDQPDPLTYASLAPVVTVGGVALDGSSRGAAPVDATGEPITAAIDTAGNVVADAVPESPVVVGAYDAVTGHNIAAPFADWLAEQPFPETWLAGRPLTEPYWHTTALGGVPYRIMVQAFERRVLTYTPDQPAGWRVESANSGAHYRAWRGLAQPDDADLISLASTLPFGEPIVAAATEYGVDPFLLAGVARAASGSTGNPAASIDGGTGLLGVPADSEDINLLDPHANARAGADRLAASLATVDDERAALAAYWSESAVPETLIEAALAARDELASIHPIEYPVDSSAPAGQGPGPTVGSGRAAYYAESYDRDWWERTMRLYAGWGNIAEGWQYDPNGYYCVHPDFIPGQRLLLRANGIELSCTIGDTVNADHVANWRENWAIELNYPLFLALELDRSNTVEVIEISGSAAKG